MKIRNKWLDLVWRKISPRYVDIPLDVPEEELAKWKKAAKLKNMNLHQFIEYAMEENIKALETSEENNDT